MEQVTRSQEGRAPRWIQRGLLAVPFLIGAVALRLAVAPLGDAIVDNVARLTPRHRHTVSPGLVSGDLPRGRDARDAHGRSEARRLEKELSGSDRSKPPSSVRDSEASTQVQRAIVVPASAVQRAMKRRDIRAFNALAPDGTPLGARLAGVSRYGTGLRDGDIVISVANTPTPDVAAMITAAMQSAGGGAAHLSGSILRGSVTFNVVLELPQ